MSGSKVLYLYSAGEFPTRKTVWSFIYSFRRYSSNKIFYHNVSICPLPFWAKWVNFDLVIFSHFMTSPWNLQKSQWRLEKFKTSKLRSAHRLAFFQDEFFLTDFRVRFLNELDIRHVYSVAASSEWPKIYRGLDSESRVYHNLTGYIDPRDNLEAPDFETPRKLDIGYRTGWKNAEMYRLGSFGALKFQIAQVVAKSAGNLNVDIKVGESFLNGRAWFEFLKNCRYTLGVESGGSLLDEDGSIYDKIQNLLRSSPSATFDEVAQACFPGLDGNLKLRTISPRIFEAALLGTGLILVEGEYDGILQPWVNYLPLKPDFSNLEEILALVPDEKRRREMTKRTYEDLVASGRYTYPQFVKTFFSRSEHSIATRISLTEHLAYWLSFATDALSWSALGLLKIWRKLKGNG